MTTTPIGLRRQRGHHAIGALIVTMLLLLLASMHAAPAHAATLAANYQSKLIAAPSGAILAACRGWGGDADDAGRFYVPCLINGVPAIVEYSPTGLFQRYGLLPAAYGVDSPRTPGAYRIVDAAVTKDGNTVYVTTGPNLDNLGPNPDLHPYTGAPMADGARPGAILRLTRQPNGEWAHDPSFRAGPFQIGANYWSARRVDVDDAGRLYTTTNAIVYELSPTTGGVVTVFGGGAITNGVGGRWIEGLDNAQGISVSGDGNVIYVVEQQHQIVQRWVRVDGVNWRRDQGFLLGVPGAEGDDAFDYCSSPAHFQAPYDVSHDINGDVYVMDATCMRIKRYTQAGAYVSTVWQDRAQADLQHGFAMSWQGHILIPSASQLLTRTDPPARPVVGGGGGGAPAPAPAPAPVPQACVDKVGPKLKQVATERVSTTRRTSITALAVDDCGITHIRVRGHRTGRIAWVKGSTVRVPLKGWNGTKKLTVQVRDVKGRTATKRISVRLALRQPALRARTRVRIGGRHCARNPMARVGSPRTYRLADSCATIRGRVRKAQRAGSGYRYLVRVNASTARRIYSNAVGPVDIWVIADSRTTRTGRSIRARRNITARGAIVITRTRTGAFMIPVTKLTGR